MIEQTYKRELIIIVLLAFILVFAICGLVMYGVARNIIDTQLGISAQGVAVATSLVIMENVEEYQEFLEAKDAGSDYYRRMQDYFAYVKAQGDIKFIYTERRLDAETIEFVLDSEPIGTRDHSAVGSLGPNDWMREMVYNTMEPAYFKLYDHPIWGKLIIAYAPLFADDGEFIGILGVNIDSTRLFDRLNFMLGIMIATFVILIAVIFIFLIKFSHIILEPMTKDKLTGAYNRRYFEKFLFAEMKNSVANGAPLTLLMMDLDHFKKVNDTYGHIFGDTVLVAVSALIKDVLRRSDCFVRYGGEEFIAVLPNINADTGVMIAERIRKAVENYTIYNEEKDVEVKITISIGVTQMEDVNCSATELVNKADKALYQAKVERNMVCRI